MLLVFGSIRIDTKGLSDAGVYIYPPVSEGRPIRVNIAVHAGGRAAVKKWAKRLDAPVIELLDPIYDGDPKALEIAAQREVEGYEVRVYVRLAPPADTIETTGGAS